MTLAALDAAVSGYVAANTIAEPEGVTDAEYAAVLAEEMAAGRA